MEDIEKKQPDELNESKEAEKPLKGIALDFRKLREASLEERKGMLKTAQYSNASEVIDATLDRVDLTGDDPDFYAAKSRIIRIAQDLSEKNGWEKIDDVDYSQILEELKKKGIPIRPPKTSRDFI